MATRGDGFRGFDTTEHEVELLILQGGGAHGFIAPAPSGGLGMMMEAASEGGFPASSEGALDMIEVDVMGLGSQSKCRMRLLNRQGRRVGFEL
jgi:hypothetical protein